MAEEASSFLSPQLDDATSPVIARENLPAAEKLLDEAGLRRNAAGVRFSLRFKTTPQREGYEPARILQERLSKIGIQTTLEVVEPAVFLASIRRGAYELSLGRWVGVADASILERTLRTGNPSNRARYSNLKMDELLDHQQWKKVQTLMAEELPYFPLWFWKNAVLTRTELEPLSPEQISMSGGLRPLLEIRRKENFDAKVRSK
jgi:peptide/nickel transport system substrate-binding protein